MPMTRDTVETALTRLLRVTGEMLAAVARGKIHPRASQDWRARVRSIVDQWEEAEQ